MSSHRRCPKPFPRAPRGECKLCGDPILRPDGKPNRKREWHHVCKQFWDLCTDTPTQRQFLRERDGDSCAVCGRTLLRFVPDGVQAFFNGDDWSWYTKLRIEFRGEVEHRIPLWKASHVRDVVSRVWFYGPDNLELICSGKGECHKRKSKREAAERAHVKRVIKPNKPRGPKLRSRGFDKRFSKKFDGRVVPR